MLKTGKYHRLLNRQLKNIKFSTEESQKFENLIDAVNEAYLSADEDIKRLENIIEINSQELFKANQLLKEENTKVYSEALHNKEVLDKVVQNVTDIIFEVDQNGNFTYLNPAWKNYGEEEPEQSIGKNFMDFTNEIVFFDKDALEKINSRNFTDLKTSFSRYTKNNSLKWWEMSAKLLRTSDGQVDGAIGSLIDVTSFKNIQEELIKASNAKSQFLSTMSHEIRTPLNAIVAIGNLLLKQNPKEEQIENLKALKFSSKHLLHLVNDILDYNKSLAGRLCFASEPFILPSVIEGSIKSFSYLAKDKGIELISDIKPCVPHIVIGDSIRLGQILSNLISNAIKFTHKGFVRVKATCVENTDTSTKVKFEIQDSGIGIAEDKLVHIFERFTQANESTARKFGGTGLGLAICKRILELQGSDINVQSKEEQGTCFWFELTFDKTEKEAVEKLNLEKTTTQDLCGMHILLVDDNEMNILVMEQFLQNWNVTYDTAKNGLEAVNKVKTVDYDLILMDLRMPVMDGYEAVQKIRQLGDRYNQIPIIALSASVSNEVIDSVKESGMDEYVSKPFDPKDLYLKISKHAIKSTLVTI